MLVLQAGMLASMRADGPVTIEVHGGTDVPLAPPASYFRLILKPLLHGLGVPVELEVVQRGFYPEGGGVVVAKISPVREVRSMDQSVGGELMGVEGVAFSRNLPEHVTDRMAKECRERLADRHLVRMEVDRGKGPSTGAGVVLAARFSNGLVGASCLGERGLSAEKVAALAVDRLERELGASMDVHAADQLLPYMALASGPSVFTVSEVSAHLRTQMATVAKFLEVDYDVSGPGPSTVIVRPSRT
jgi:RNA 3'-phosphate cyclase